jgi:hypothetical protein
MQVKAQGLFHAARYIESQYGQDGLRDVLRACSDPVRERYTSASSLDWHPVEELIELVQRADEMLAHGHGKLAEHAGAEAARAHTRGLFRFVAHVATPEFLMRRIAGTWRQLNDAGSLELLDIDDHACEIEVKDIPDPHPIFCSILTGWIRELTRAVGRVSPLVKHKQCRAKGATRCLWDAKWSGVATSELLVSSLVPSPAGSRK